MLELWEHQKEALEAMRGKRGFLLACDPGTGKTGIAISWLRELYNQEKRIAPTLILTPPVVIRQFAKEFGKFSKIDARKIIPLTGSGRKRLETLRKEDPNSIFITNYESLLMKEVYEWLLKSPPYILIADEVHLVKNPTAKRTKALEKLAEKASYRLGMTGTPILKDALDLFAPMKILEPSVFGKNFFIFRAKYFVDFNAGMPKHIYFPDWRVRPGALKEIERVLSEVSYSIRKEDALDLPPLIFQERYVELSPEQRKHYVAMEKDLVSYLDDAACVAPLALTKILRLLQITSGHLPLDSGEVHSFGGIPRLVALSDLLTEHTGRSKVIVWAQFRADYGAIRALIGRLQIHGVELTGESSESVKRDSIAQFKEDPNVRVLISNPSSGGIGLNLAESNVNIFYSKGFSLGTYLQALARNHRGGSEIHEKVLSISLIAENTIDEEVHERLLAKEELSIEFLRSLKNRLQGRTL
jgi:SNF2 family DNA or RNA helicase